MPPKKYPKLEPILTLPKPKEEVAGKEETVSGTGTGTEKPTSNAMAAAQEPVKGRKIEEETFNEIIKNEAFLEWFWDNNNGNGLANNLNDYAEMKGLDRRIRREKESPVEEKIDKKMVEVKQSGERDVIDVFKDIQFITDPPKKYQNEWFDQEKEK